MSSASMVTPSAASSSSGGGGDNDDVSCRACYGVVVACLSLLLFCVLAGTVGVIKACAVTGLAVAFLGFVGWLALPVGAPGGGGATAAQRAGGDVAAGATTALRRARHAFGLVGAAAAVHVPPAFVYECPVDAENVGGGGKPGGCGSLCAVCLEDVQRGEAVRLLPACGHLFHMECVDMWLHSHTTCPLCRSDLLAPPRNHAAKSVTAAADAVPPQSSSSTDVLPPV